MINQRSHARQIVGGEITFSPHSYICQERSKRSKVKNAVFLTYHLTSDDGHLESYVILHQIT